MSDSRVIRRAGGGWSGIERARYKDEADGPGCFLGATRHTLLGATSDGPADDLNFEVRYFELEPGERDRPVAVPEEEGAGKAARADAVGESAGEALP